MANLFPLKPHNVILEKRDDSTTTATADSNQDDDENDDDDTDVALDHLVLYTRTDTSPSRYICENSEGALECVDYSDFISMFMSEYGDDSYTSYIASDSPPGDITVTYTSYYHHSSSFSYAQETTPPLQHCR